MKAFWAWFLLFLFAALTLGSFAAASVLTPYWPYIAAGCVGVVATFIQFGEALSMLPPPKG